MSKSEVKQLINTIFDYIDNGVSATGDLIESHPALYFIHSKEELKTKIEEFINSKESFDIYDIYYFSNKMIKYLVDNNDSHTCVKFINVANPCFPIKLKVLDNKLYIVEANKDYSNFKFKEIITINNIKIDQLIKEIEEITSYSTLEYLKTKIEYGLVDSGVLKSLPSIDNNCNQFKYTFVDNSELILNSDKEYEQLKYKENYQYKIINDVIYILYNECKDLNKMKAFISEISKVSFENRISKFIVDIRGNIGGDSRVNDPLLDFLKNKEVVTLIDGEVFSSGRWACIGLKSIGSKFIGTNIGTTINAFGYVTKPLILDKYKLRVIKSIYYMIFNGKEILYLNKNDFNNCFKDKESFINFDKVEFLPDILIEPTIDDYKNSKDKMLEIALEKLKGKVKNIR